jgi:D-arabinose 1-dehydrogenase-like Zn-dependent alcohol dehydrogenase
MEFTEAPLLSPAPITELQEVLNVLPTQGLLRLATNLGAHLYIDAKAEDAGAALQTLGGADVTLATALSGSAIGSLLPGLSVRGKLVGH